MKKDIDLLSGFNEAKEKKSSSSSSLILVVGVVVIVGVMLFMFITSKLELKDKQDLIDQMDQQLQQNGNIAHLEEQLNKDKARYATLLQEGIQAVSSGKAGMQPAEISSKIMTILYDNYINIPAEDGKPRVQLNGLNITETGITFSCATRTYQDAWDFVDYIRGKPQAPLKEGATDAEKAVYEDMAKKLEANSRYFSNVLESYPGLPVEGSGEDYTIGFALNVNVDWGAMAQDETK